MNEKQRFIRSLATMPDHRPAAPSLHIGQTVSEHDDPSWLGTVKALSDDGFEAQVDWGGNLVSWVECRDLRTGFEVQP